jgi:N-methylhydantoinase A
MPGPACYDLGGDEPTITDAALVLGLLNAKRFLAGRQSLNINKAREAISRHVAAPLGMTVGDAAYAIYQVAAALMVDAIYLLTVRRGHDPREFSLMLYGGASPLFAGPISAGLDIRTLVIPANSSVFSAEGMLHADLHADVVRSVLRRLSALENTDLMELVKELKGQGSEQLLRMGVGRDAQRFTVSCDVRYIDQHHEIAVPLPGHDGANLLPEILATFHRLHEHLYGYSESDREAMLINVRVAATEITQQSMTTAAPHLRSQSPPAFREEREARWEEDTGFALTPVYAGDDLSPGDSIHGPAIIEKAYTTVVLPSAAHAVLDSAYNIIIELAGAREQ